jgi:hypothetical protein
MNRIMTYKQVRREIAQSWNFQSEDTLAISIGMRMQSLPGMDVYLNMVRQCWMQPIYRPSYAKAASNPNLK